MSEKVVSSVDEQPKIIMPSYIMVPLRDAVVLPGITSNVDIGRDKSRVALNRVLERREHIFLVPQKHNGSNPAPKDIFRTGTVCRIKQVLKLPNDIMRVTVEGIRKATISNFVSINPCFEVEVNEVNDVEPDDFVITALKKIILGYVDDFAKLDSKLQDIPKEYDIEVNPDIYTNYIASIVLSKIEQKRAFLSTNALHDRMQILSTALYAETEILKLEKKLQTKVRKSIDQNQKEYYLREQAKAIHQELGDGEDELEEYLEKAEKLKLPEEAMEKVSKEVKRMQKMSATSPEASVSRSYIEWILDMPWNTFTEDNKDLVRAEKILDEDHYGLKKVKQRILEYLAVVQLTKTLKSPILCFVGPPGVGKTSIVRSIAKTLDRKFVSMSLGGVKDEAEIRGHRRTYIGAIPGRIIYHLKQVGSSNPVFLLDEIDKISSDLRGDPASVMLEVLDPEQNFQFRDHYLELPYDLSKVMFVTTANSLETIPPPLIDRMEIIELNGYTEEEKTEIAKRYLLPKQQKFNGLEKAEIIMDDDVIRQIISMYTRESGVRSLEREIAGVCRKIAFLVVREKEKLKGHEPFRIDKDSIHEYLGVPKYNLSEEKRNSEIGVATGLAWTSVGGKTMPVEVGLMPNGKGDITLTGQLGDVMKESARTAISVVRSKAIEWKIDPIVFTTTDIHLHVPEGATPKDGPSAGITIASAILSAFAAKPVKGDLAMTGEITLRGKVLAIGGLKEKMLAAHRVGITNLIIPKANEKDLEEIPKNIRESFKISLTDTIDEVFELAIE